MAKMDGMGLLKGVGISVLGAGVGLVAGWGLQRAASLSQVYREVIMAGVGLVALAGATYFGKPVIGVAIATATFYYAIGSAGMRMGATTAATSALNSALSAAGLSSAPPAALPAASGAGAPAVAPARYPAYSVMGY